MRKRADQELVEGIAMNAQSSSSDVRVYRQCRIAGSPDCKWEHWKGPWAGQSVNARPRRWKMGKFAFGSEGDAFRLGPDQAELKHADRWIAFV